jgi:type IV pilus assembly protein PilB
MERLRQPAHASGSGIVVVTGPTGSGKTTTLYGALRELADGKVNIMTVEDPIEYELPGITQTQVADQAGHDICGSTLRAMLRQDPDVILVGEIRDQETAVTAAQAAMTGHLVLTTVHANDAVSSVGASGRPGPPVQPPSPQTLRGARWRSGSSAPDLLPPAPSRSEGRLTPDERRLTEAPRHRARRARRGMPRLRVHRLPRAAPRQRGARRVAPALQAAIEQQEGLGHPPAAWQSQGGMRTLHRGRRSSGCQSGKTTLVEVERVLGPGDLEEQAREGCTAGARTRILLVDDEQDARVLMRALLERDSYEVEEAEDGHKALDILKEDQGFSLIILDLAMPGLDGRQVLQQIRGSVDTAALPVLIRTGTGSDVLEAELLEAGADDYVDKSVDADRFMARVHAVLRRAM